MQAQLWTTFFMTGFTLIVLLLFAYLHFLRYRRKWCIITRASEGSLVYTFSICFWEGRKTGLLLWIKAIFKEQCCVRPLWEGREIPEELGELLPASFLNNPLGLPGWGTRTRCAPRYGLLGELQWLQGPIMSSFPLWETHGPGTSGGSWSPVLSVWWRGCQRPWP